MAVRGPLQLAHHGQRCAASQPAPQVCPLALAARPPPSHRSGPPPAPCGTAARAAGRAARPTRLQTLWLRCTHAATRRPGPAWQWGRTAVPGMAGCPSSQHSSRCSMHTAGLPTSSPTSSCRRFRKAMRCGSEAVSFRASSGCRRRSAAAAGRCRAAAADSSRTMAATRASLYALSSACRSSTPAAGKGAGPGSGRRQ